MLNSQKQLFRTVNMILEVMGNAKNWVRNGQEMIMTKCEMMQNGQKTV